MDYKLFHPSLLNLTDPDDFSLRKFSDAEFSQLQTEFLEIDSQALDAGTFWKESWMRFCESGIIERLLKKTLLSLEPFYYIYPMSTSFLTFQKFNDADLAAAIGEQLAAEGIDYVVENEARHYDPVLVANVPEPTVHLKIPGSEFTHAHAVLEAYYEKQLQEVDPDYYLLTFTDAELLDILSKPDEWGHFDYVLAKKLLTDRGRAITEDFAQQQKAQRLEELAQYEDPTITGPGGSPFGLGSLLTGHFVATHKKTLPDGRQVHAYSPAVRRRGKRFFIIAVVVLVLLLLARLAQMHG